MKLTLQRVVDDDILTIVHWRPTDFPSVYVGYDELTLGDPLYKYTWGVKPAHYPVPALYDADTAIMFDGCLVTRELFWQEHGWTSSND